MTAQRKDILTFILILVKPAELSVQYVWETVPTKHFAEYPHEISSKYEDKTMPTLSYGVCRDKKSNASSQNTCNYNKSIHLLHYQFKFKFL